MTSLAPGDFLGPYEILGPIGAGGMGEVYRARDPRLGREVAIKVSAERFSERFEREARAVAALNHPNICTLYDVGPNYLVMEYIEGESPKGPLPLDEALRIGRQIGEAMSAAHEKGIVHRDLKPANIRVRADGTVKVLDFGLAKVAPAPGGDSRNSPTLTMGATQAGVILGTAAYMAPEQARGEAVDKRADIWSFGVVLYELLAGQHLFASPTISDTLAAVLTKDPDWNRVPAQARRMLGRCLERDPRRRLHDVADAWALLEEAPAIPAARSRLPWMIAAACILVAAAALWQPWRPRSSLQPALQPLVRLDVDLGSETMLGAAVGALAVLSPDGSRLVYCSQSRLFMRRLDQAKAIELPGTESPHAPFFSPDGQWVGFFANGELKKVSVQGGSAITLCPASNAFGGSWGEDGNIIASLSPGPLSRISSAGGAPTRVTETAPGERTHRWPQALPGGRGFIFAAYAPVFGLQGAKIELVTPDGRRKTLLRSAIWARYAPSGHLVFVDGGTLFAVQFDLDRLDLRGAPVPILGDVAYSPAFGATYFDFSGAPSGSGIAVYQSREAGGGLTTLQWLDSSGKTQPMLSKPGDRLVPHLSPDGSRVAFASGGEVWVYDSRGDTLARLTVGGGGTYAAWHSDGRHLVVGIPGGLAWARVDQAGAPQPLLKREDMAFPFSISADGKRLAFMELNPRTGFDIWTVPLETGAAGLRAGEPEPFLQTPFDERHPTFSPDLRWIAYASNEPGAMQVFVRSFPGGGGKWQVSNAGGAYPVWSHGGRELLFRTIDGRIMAASYTVQGDSFVAERPRLWTPARLANVGW